MDVFSLISWGQFEKNILTTEEKSLADWGSGRRQLVATRPPEKHPRRRAQNGNTLAKTPWAQLAAIKCERREDTVSICFKICWNSWKMFYYGKILNVCKKKRGVSRSQGPILRLQQPSTSFPAVTWRDSLVLWHQWSLQCASLMDKDLFKNDCIITPNN